MFRFLLTMLFLVPAFFSFSQENRDSTKNSALKVFIDCESCDIENLRQDFYFLNYVRDRKLADVHVLVTTRANGAGGTEFTLSFYGYSEFLNMNDTIVTDLPPNSTSDELRDHLNQNIQLGLIRYLMRTDMRSHITINYDGEAPVNDTVKDKWNYWVFNLSANGWFNGQSLVSYTSLNGNISANRVTEKGKTNLMAHHNYTRNVYQVNDTTKVTGLFKTYYGSGKHVWSLSDHWSAGLNGNYYSSLYENIHHSFSGGLSLEYDIFPYDESTTRMLYFSYSIQPTYRKYFEQTVLFRDEQYLMGNSLSFNSKFIGKWGNLTSQLSWNSYLHDLSISNTSLYLSAQLRVFKGLFIELSGYYAMIRNQINLPLEAASEEEILLQQVQLPTSKQYWCSLGVSYTFGSIYNNIVNPRLED